MTPLARVAWGFLVVVVDFRIDGFDLVADPLGWGLVLAGLVPLSQRSPWFMAAAVSAGVGLLLSLPQLVAEPEGLLAAGQSVVDTGLVFCTCTGIMQLVDGPSRATANRIRWADLALGAAALAAGLAADESGAVSGGGAGLLLLLVLAALAVVAWFAIFLLGTQRHPGLGAMRTGGLPRPRTP